MTSIASPASNPEPPVAFGAARAFGSESRPKSYPFNQTADLATDETLMEHGLGAENCFPDQARILQLQGINLMSQYRDFGLFPSVFVLCFIRGQLNFPASGGATRQPFEAETVLSSFL